MRFSPIAAAALAAAAIVLAGCVAPEEATPPGNGSASFDPPTPLDATPPAPPTPPPRRPETRDVELALVASAVDRPVQVTHAGDGTDRLFVVEKTGKIRVIREGAIADAPYADLAGKIRWGGEQGLLSLAFHPRFAENGLAFVAYTARDNAVTVERYEEAADGARVDPATASLVLRLPKSDPNHNGGTLAFGPDGMLYVSVGDGGGAGDPEGDAQDPESLFGKILRLDVDAAEPYAIPPDNPFGNEVWDLGLRNPWRMSFDRETGDLWIGDVGQREREEVNMHPAGEAAPLNFGWNAWEGTRRYRADVAVEEAVAPVHEYDHDAGCAIAGGFVYRGSAIPALRGAYLYSDLCAGAILAIDEQVDGSWNATVLLETELAIVSFGEDGAGEIFVVHHVPDGTVHGLVPRAR